MVVRIETVVVVMAKTAVMIEMVVVAIAKTEKAAADGNSGDSSRDGISEGTLVCK
jgi:hypothetical protein